MLNPEKGPLDAYLDINNIIKIAKAKGVDAIHPGYGFLSENPEFVEACEKEGIAFIGPNVDVMYKMGDKISSKKMAIECNVPIIPGVDHAVRSLDEVMEVAREGRLSRYAEGIQRRRRSRYAYCKFRRGNAQGI